MGLPETFQCADRDCHARVDWRRSDIAMANKGFIGKDVPAVGYKSLGTTV